MDHTGFPVYTGPVEPGSTHDLTAARLHVLPALYRAAWLGMPVLADKGYQGAGIGVPAPTKNPCPTPDEQTHNNLLSAMRAPAEREGAMFKHSRALQRASPGPRDHQPRSWPPPSSSSPSGTNPDTNPGEKGSLLGPVSQPVGGEFGFAGVHLQLLRAPVGVGFPVAEVGFAHPVRLLVQHALVGVHPQV